MAEGLNSIQIASDHYVDRHCEPCYQTKLSYIKEYGFCQACYQFLCEDCHKIRHHGNDGNTHILQRGGDMPTSIAEKPPRYVICDVHPPKLKNMFCCDDNAAICSLCMLDHTTCIVRSIEEVSKFIPSSDVDCVYEAIRRLEVEAKSIHSSINIEMGKLDKQKQTMINKSQAVYDTVLTKINKMFIESKTLIESEFDDLKSGLIQRKKMLDDVLENLKAILQEGQAQTGKCVDANRFLQIQEIMRETNNISDDIRMIRKSPRVSSCVFIQSELIRELISAEGNFGAVRIHKKDDTLSNDEFRFAVNFPTSLHETLKVITDNLVKSNLNTDNNSTLTPIQPNYPNISASKIDSYNVKVDDDIEESFCTITDMAIIENKRRLLIVDGRNCKVKLFSIKPKHLRNRGLKFYSSVRVPNDPWGIAVINDQEEVVNTCNGRLVFLNIFDKQLVITKIKDLGFSVNGIASHGGKLAICCPDTDPPSIKLIDQKCTVLWTVSHDQSGRQLFYKPLNVCLRAVSKNNSAEFAVSDGKSNTLTLLDAETGKVAATSKLKVKEPTGISCDTAGNIYVCHFSDIKISVMFADLSEQRTLLAVQDGLGRFPTAVLHDNTKNQLIISYSGNDNTVDYFRLSEIGGLAQ